VVAYIVLIQDNRSVQAETNQPSNSFNQSIQLGRINDALIARSPRRRSKQRRQAARALGAKRDRHQPHHGAPEKQATPAAAPPPGRDVVMALGRESERAIVGFGAAGSSRVVALFVLMAFETSRPCMTAVP